MRLGDRVRDTITGFEGVLLARTQYLYRPAQLLIQPTTTGDDGKPIDEEWFDEGRIECVASGKSGIGFEP